MKTSLKKLFLILTVLFCFQNLFSQVACDPNQQFYEACQSWQARKIIKKLPPLRPYPMQVINSIIKEVIENGTIYDRELAEEFQISFSKPLNIESEIKDTIKIQETDKDNQLLMNPSITGDLFIYPQYVSYSYKLGWYNTTNESSFLPMYKTISYDSIHDSASINRFNSYLNSNSSIALGTENIFLQAGIYRTGFGNRLNEGLALNESSYHSGNFSLSFIKDKVSYAQQMSVLGATTNTNYSDEPLPNKFLAFHVLQYDLLPSLTVSYYENIVFGGRFDPSYLFPSPYMVTQGMNGCNDNLQMGLYFTYRPFKGFSFINELFVDDLSVNELVKFNFNSKNRVAFSTALQYFPESKMNPKLELSYLFITPYTYSHWDYDDYKDYRITKKTINYQNYTNNGITIGSPIPPNSDRIAFSFNLNPLKNLSLSFTTDFIRHANICESLTDEEGIKYLLAENNVYSTDGSIFTHPMYSDSKHVDTAWNELNFLTQEHKMYILQLGVNGEYKISKSKIGELTFTLSYMFEYINNKGVDTALYSGGSLKQEDDNTFTWNNNTYNSKSQLISAVKKEWSSKFCDVMNNFISIGFTLKY